jgi:hypothetical protein
MQLLPNWRAVLRRAWSIKLIVVAGLLSGLEAALPLMDWLPVPPGVFAALSFIVTAAAFVARLIAQSSIGGKE